MHHAYVTSQISMIRATGLPPYSHRRPAACGGSSISRCAIHDVGAALSLLPEVGRSMGKSLTTTMPPKVGGIETSTFSAADFRMTDTGHALMSPSRKAWRKYPSPRSEHHELLGSDNHTQ